MDTPSYEQTPAVPLELPDAGGPAAVMPLRATPPARSLRPGNTAE
jgi:hypothetical protein